MSCDVGHGTRAEGGSFHHASAVTSRGPRFVLVIDRDGVSVPWTRGRRLAFWLGRSARRRFGLVEVFKPRERWI